METRAGMWTWLLQRITALYIVVGLAIHFYLHHFFLSANKGSEVVGDRFFTAQQIKDRLTGNSGWMVFYFLFLFCCVYHGVFGLLKVIEDHVKSEKAIVWMNRAAWVLVVALMIAGMVVYQGLKNSKGGA